MLISSEYNAPVLIVDDEPFFRKVIADILRGAGFTAIEASSGADVVRHLSRDKVGLVLTDLEMPETSGFEILGMVRELAPDVPVVVISAHQDFYAARKVLSGGAIDYLVKPFRDEELLAVVEKGLDRYGENLAARHNREHAERLFTDLVLLREVGETASGDVDLETFLEQVVDKVIEAVAVETASLMLPDEQGNLRIRAGRGLPDGVREKTVVRPGEGVSGHVFETGEPLLLFDILDDERFVPSGDEGQYSTTSALSLPLNGRDRVIGVLNVNNKVGGGALSAADQALLASISHQASLAIENFTLTRELHLKARKIEALNAARSRLVCTLSHELNTPLTMILGFADLLQEHRTEFGEEQIDEYLGKIADSSQQMEKLISGMLLLFSIDSGTASWHAETVSLADCCLKELDACAEQIALCELRVMVEFPEGMPSLMADPEKLRLLLAALIDNAIKFNVQGGRLSLFAEQRWTDELPRLYLRIYNDGEHVPLEEAESVFTQYSQLGEINTAKPEGIGIGLALCRVIVERMGGEIFLEETGGSGTAFGLLFPVDNPGEETVDE